jgi:hypothetical protein
MTATFLRTAINIALLAGLATSPLPRASGEATADELRPKPID